LKNRIFVKVCITNVLSDMSYNLTSVDLLFILVASGFMPAVVATNAHRRGGALCPPLAILQTPVFYLDFGRLTRSLRIHGGNLRMRGRMLEQDDWMSSF